jgi:hypothetical protein
MGCRIRGLNPGRGEILSFISFRKALELTDFHLLGTEFFPGVKADGE